MARKGSTAKGAKAEEPQAAAVGEAPTTPGLANQDLRRDLEASSPTPAPKGRKKKTGDKASMRKLQPTSELINKNLCESGHVLELLTSALNKSSKAYCERCHEVVTEDQIGKGFYACQKCYSSNHQECVDKAKEEEDN